MPVAYSALAKKGAIKEITHSAVDVRRKNNRTLARARLCERGRDRVLISQKVDVNIRPKEDGSGICNHDISSMIFNGDIYSPHVRSITSPA